MKQFILSLMVSCFIFNTSLVAKSDSMFKSKDDQENEVPSLVVENVFESNGHDSYKCIGWTASHDERDIEFLTEYPLNMRALKDVLRVELEKGRHDLKEAVAVAGITNLVHLWELHGPTVPLMLIVGAAEGFHISKLIWENHEVENVEKVLITSQIVMGGEDDVYAYVPIEDKLVKTLKHYLEHHEITNYKDLGTCADIDMMRQLGR